VESNRILLEKKLARVSITKRKSIQKLQITSNQTKLFIKKVIVDELQDFTNVELNFLS
jgi:hypothetical protein